jgi:gliding motility-associated-like protein
LSSSNASPITGTWSSLTIDTSTVGIFPYIFTADPGQCASIVPITVSVSVVNPPNSLVSLDWTVSDAFVDNQIVTVIPNAAGTYLYQLDSGPFQSSPVFEYVASGVHSISVKDSYGCNSPLTENNVLVINSPKFFTPNGDGFNDTWNIFDLKDQINSRIYIFDRYGKLLKEISPKGAGWDGNYIGHPMPATDYWFTVDYAEQSIAKKFKSHFSLKR